MNRIKTLLVACSLLCSFYSCGEVTKRMDAKLAESKAAFSVAESRQADGANSNSLSSESSKSSATVDDAASEYKNLEIPARLQSVSEQILHRMGYTVSYNAERRAPNWVAWCLTPKRLKGNTKRSDSKFHEDTDVSEPRALDSDYVRSGYDRGHMCPAGDNKWSARAMDESFLFTNICPQAPQLNRGDWNEMEQACRKWAKQEGALYIVCGPIYYKKNSKTIGKNHVAVPDAFFKVLLSMKGEPKAIGFIYKNGDGNRPKGDYANSVDEVERITGIDFFPALPDDIEKKVEAVCNPADWDI